MNLSHLIGLDHWSPVAFHRVGTRMILLFFGATLPVMASVGPAVSGLVEGDPQALLLAVVAVLAAIVTLLGGIVALVRSWVARMEPRLKGAEGKCDNSFLSSLVARNATEIAELTKDVGMLRDTMRNQGEQIEQMRRTSENNLNLQLRKMEEYNGQVMGAISGIGRTQVIIEARLAHLENAPSADEIS